jgi:hypothetical protein
MPRVITHTRLDRSGNTRPRVPRLLTVSTIVLLRSALTTDACLKMARAEQISTMSLTKRVASRGRRALGRQKAAHMTCKRANVQICKQTQSKKMTATTTLHTFPHVHKLENQAKMSLHSLGAALWCPQPAHTQRVARHGPGRVASLDHAHNRQR